MARLRWYKAEPRAFFDATRRWPFELKAAYRLVLDLVYAQDGVLPDDDRWIAGELGCDVRVWRRLKARLLELGKLYVDDGAIHNPRADRDVLVALARLEQTVTAGERSGEERRKSETKSSDFNGSGGTPVPTPVRTIKTEIKTKKEKKDSSPPPSESPPCAQAREEPAPAGPVVATSSLFLIRSKERCSEAEANARWQRIVKAAEGNEGRAVVAVDVAYHHGPLGVPLTTYAIGVCRREIARVEALAKADLASTAHAAERQDRIYEAEMRVLYGDDWTMHKPGHA